MSVPVYYSGPGKVYYKSPVTNTVIGFQPEGENGPCSFSLEEKTTERGASMYGQLFETLDDQVVKITVSPFDNWSLLPILFPTYLGVTTLGTNGGTGSLAIGTSPHDPTNAGTIYPAGVYVPDGRQYNAVRAAITKHPSMKLGAGDKLFGGIELTGLGQLSVSSAIGLPGSASNGWIMSTSESVTTGAPITETGATDPDTTGFGTADFAQTHWTGNWGASAITGFDNMEAEQGWDLMPEIKYQTYTVQKISRIMKLISARFMIKARIVGPSHTNLLAKILTHSSGALLVEGTAKDLVLTGSNGKTITLKNCEVKNAPFTFGGTSLNTGEIAFVQTIPVTGGAASPSLVFSA